VSRSRLEPFVDHGDVDGGFVADGELVVSGRHGTVALEAVDTAFKEQAAVLSYLRLVVMIVVPSGVW